MRIPLETPCEKCGEPVTVRADLNAPAVDIACKCGWKLAEVLTGSLQPELLLLRRAQHEFAERQDSSLCIVLAAMAVECLLSRLYFKWSPIEVDPNDDNRRPAHEKLEKQFRKLGPAKKKLATAADLMHSEGLSAFVRRSPEIRGVISSGFPSLNADDLPQTIVEGLFWPRNRILHLGRTDSVDENSAARAFNVAQLVIRIYHLMDEEKAQEGQPRGIPAS